MPPYILDMQGKRRHAMAYRSLLFACEVSLTHPTIARRWARAAESAAEGALDWRTVANARALLAVLA